MNTKKTHRLLGLLLAILLFAGVLLLPSVGADNVTVNDANLKAALTSALGTSSITTDNMKTLTVLDLSDRKISDLTGLEAAVNLKQLSLRNNSVADISALSGLTSLTTLDLSGNQITSVTALASMSSLRVLHLTDNRISSLVPLETLQKLQFLFCENNRLDLSDGSAAAQSVTTLSFRGCYVVTGTQNPDTSDSVVTDAKITAKTGSGAKIDRTNGYLCGIAPATPVTSVQSLLESSGCTLRVLNAAGEAASGNFATGMTVQLINSVGTVLDELTVVVYGDINGDGIVDVIDLAMMRKQIVGSLNLSGAKFTAANLYCAYKKDSSDAIIDVMDLALMRKYLLGSISFS